MKAVFWLFVLGIVTFLVRNMIWDLQVHYWATWMDRLGLAFFAAGFIVGAWIITHD